jgi:hypothetical protein
MDVLSDLAAAVLGVAQSGNLHPEWQGAEYVCSLVQWGARLILWAKGLANESGCGVFGAPWRC